MNAPPSSSRMNETSAAARTRDASPGRGSPSAAAHTLSAVPMSTRFTLRCAGTDGRCTTPGVNTHRAAADARRARARARAARRCRPDRLRRRDTRGAGRASVGARDGVSGRPYPDGPAIRSTRRRLEQRDEGAGSASASAVGNRAVENDAPASRPQTSMLIVPGSMPTASTAAR